jgi:hypothetical protein
MLRQLVHARMLLARTDSAARGAGRPARRRDDVPARSSGTKFRHGLRVRASGMESGQGAPPSAFRARRFGHRRPVPLPRPARVGVPHSLRRAHCRRSGDSAETHVFESAVGSLNRRSSPTAVEGDTLTSARTPAPATPRTQAPPAPAPPAPAPITQAPSASVPSTQAPSASVPSTQAPPAPAPPPQASAPRSPGRRPAAPGGAL